MYTYIALRPLGVLRGVDRDDRRDREHAERVHRVLYARDRMSVRARACVFAVRARNVPPPPPTKTSTQAIERSNGRMV